MTDSQMSLDVPALPLQTPAMTPDTDTLYLERCDPARNMARYYAFSIECDLFEAVVAVRRWGRIGVSMRQVCLPCPDRETAARMLAEIAAVKRRRGYIEPVGTR